MSDLYDEDKIFEIGIKRIQKDKKISERNKKLIFEFKDHLLARGVGKIRIGSFYFHKLAAVCHIIDKDFDKATKKDIEKVMAEIQNGYVVKGKRKIYTPSTRDCYRIALKCFYRWLHDLDSSDPAPDIVKWLKRENPKNGLRKEDLLTPQEVKKFINSTKNLMHKAMVSVLYEGALRPEELRGMRIKDCIFTEKNVKVYVRGKMEKKQGERFVFLYGSYSILRSCIEGCPYNSSPEAYIWSNDNGKKPMGDKTFAKVVERMRDKSGIKKRIWPYLFRHTRATELYAALGEALAKKFLGHADDSRMAKVYNHLNEEDLERGLDTIAGIKNKEKKESGLCPRCQKPTGYDTSICNSCGHFLDTKSAIQYEETNISSENLKKIVDFARLLNDNPMFMELAKNPKFIDQLAEQKAREMAKRHD